MTRLIWSNDKPPGARRTADESSGQNDHPARALCAGERSPDFRLPDQVGHLVTLSALVAKGPVVLRFCRHRDASPRLGELDDLAAFHLECEKRGATLAVIAAA
jgi:peroxiredoxin